MLTAGYVGQSSRPPVHPTLVYDGGCGFCRKWVDRVRRLDRRGDVRYVPLQENRAVDATGRPRDALARAVHFVHPDGQVFAGAAAVRELFRYLPGGAMVRGLLAMPGAMPAAERLYAWIARTWGPVQE